MHTYTGAVVLVVFQVDSSLSFLDEFVSEALAAGAAPYKPPHQRQEELARVKGKTQGKKKQTQNRIQSACLFADCDVFRSAQPGAVRPLTPHQHVFLQYCRQTLSHAAVHQFRPVRHQRRPVKQRRVGEHLLRCL